MRDSQATRRRILDAATVEFATHGIAGARVDRIAKDARTNKAQMYAYFGSKDALFDTVFAGHLAGILDAVPLVADDLPEYAVRLYDQHLAHPEFVRLAAVARLERIPVGELVTDPHGHADKRRAITEAQKSGSVTPELDPDDVLAAVIAVAMTWSPISLTHAASQHDEPAEHARRRNFLREAVRRLVAP